tara:strand:- start:30 stop:248 length:219 start_codon:yes stop_codon:yes gene_type:complete
LKSSNHPRSEIIGAGITKGEEMSKKLFKIWKELKTIDERESVLKCFKRRKNKKLYFAFKKIHIENYIEELCK